MFFSFFSVTGSIFVCALETINCQDAASFRKVDKKTMVVSWNADESSVLVYTAPVLPVWHNSAHGHHVRDRNLWGLVTTDFEHTGCRHADSECHSATAIAVCDDYRLLFRRRTSRELFSSNSLKDMTGCWTRIRALMCALCTSVSVGDHRKRSQFDRS